MVTRFDSDSAFAYTNAGFNTAHDCWWRGILLPIVLLVVGLACLLTPKAWLFGQGRLYPVHNSTASVLQGLMFLAWAFGLHLRHMWSAVPRFASAAWFVGFGGYIAAATLAVWFIYLCLRYVFG